MNNFFISGKAGNIDAIHDDIKKDKLENISAIICHPHPLYQGSMHNKIVTTISRAMRTFGIESYRFNYRGVGASDGEYGDGFGELDDLLSVYEWVKKEKPGQKIVLCGFSFGGAIAYKAFEKIDNLSMLITVAPAVDRFDLTNYPEPKNIPWLVIQGMDDDTVNPDSVFDFTMKKIKSELTLVKMNEVGHFFHGRLVDLKQVIENFLEPIKKTL
ncbi:alpha/beta hydrolase [Francisella frigiditurris]|uniref:Dienelactone hydrolase family protein n=1 Tax=Francisella frigiditurris TaxID=1542390 RepID=A0A1J0KTB1_9GAMM|nr:alpha/beta fold hydrolase [Francisella frigiditurris]APC96876.1 dienelactone hydrolase family protein [Francisella frigiditurris]